MVFFYISLNPNLSKKFKLDLLDIKLENLTLKQLRNKIESIKNINLPKNYDLVFFGRCLRKEKNLCAYGIENGAVIYVLENYKNISENDLGNKKKQKLDQRPTSSQIQNMIVGLKKTVVKLNFTTILTKLYNKEFREMYIERIPELRDNIIALSLMQNLDLLTILTDRENLTKVLLKYPLVAEATFKLVALYQEQNASSVQSNDQSSTMLFSENSFNMPVDVFERRVDATPSNVQNSRSTRNNRSMRITRDMLLQAIQEASGEAPSTSQEFPIGISREQFLDAFYNSSNPNNTSTALNTSTTSANSSNLATSTVASSSNISTISPMSNLSNINTDRNRTTHSDNGWNWLPELRQLHEMGIFNDSLSVQFLELTNGNIEETVNFMLSIDLN